MARNTFAHRGLVALTAAAVAAAVSITVAAASREWEQESATSPGVIGGFGITMRLPPGWDGRVHRRSAHDPVTLEAASVPLAPIADDSFQHTEARMGAGDSYISLSDIGSLPSGSGREPAWKQAAAQLEIEMSDVHRYVEGHTLPANVALPFLVNERALMLYVGFGAWPDEAMLERTNDALASLTISPR